MFFHRKVAKTPHYIENHEADVPWREVLDIISKSSKTMRIKQGMVEIENNEYYLLCRLEQNILFVINAKRKR